MTITELSLSRTRGLETRVRKKETKGIQVTTRNMFGTFQYKTYLAFKTCNTVEVSNTGHIIMFKVILKLFAGTFPQFFLEKKLYQYFYFSYLIQFTRIGHEKYFILFFKSAGRCYTCFV